MGRPKKNPTLDEQIKKAEEKVFKYYEPYNKALEELKALRDQKQEFREQKLLEAIRKSHRSNEEIIRFLEGDTGEDNEW